MNEYLYLTHISIIVLTLLVLFHIKRSSNMKQSGNVMYLHFKQIHQLLFYCNSDNAAAQGVPAA